MTIAEMHLKERSTALIRALRQIFGSSKSSPWESQEIIETVKALHVSIERRFPNSGLGKISAELLRVAEENIVRVQWIQKPNFLLRFVAALLSIGMIVMVAGLATHIHQFQMNDYTNFIQALDASIGSVASAKAQLPSVPTARPRPQFAIWCEPGPWS